jgi:hypothetical protein
VPPYAIDIQPHFGARGDALLRVFDRLPRDLFRSFELRNFLKQATLGVRRREFASGSQRLFGFDSIRPPIVARRRDVVNRGLPLALSGLQGLNLLRSPAPHLTDGLGVCNRLDS